MRTVRRESRRRRGMNTTRRPYLSKQSRRDDIALCREVERVLAEESDDETISWEDIKRELNLTCQA